jgi:hypothetical protein
VEDGGTFYDILDARQVRKDLEMVLGTPSLVHAGIDGVLATGSSVLGVGRQCGGGVVERSSRGGRRGRGRSQRHSSAGGQVQRRRGRGSS